MHCLRHIRRNFLFRTKLRSSLFFISYRRENVVCMGCYFSNKIIDGNFRVIFFSLRIYEKNKPPVPNV